MCVCVCVGVTVRVWMIQIKLCASPHSHHALPPRSLPLFNSLFPSALFLSLSFIFPTSHLHHFIPLSLFSLLPPSSSSLPPSLPPPFSLSPFPLSLYLLTMTPSVVSSQCSVVTVMALTVVDMVVVRRRGDCSVEALRSG